MGFSCGFKNNLSKVDIECKDGHEVNRYSIRLTSFLRDENSNGCKACAKISTSEANSKSMDETLDRIFKTGKFVSGTIFGKSLKLDTKGRANYWKYYCPVCAKDGFAIEKISNVVFESHISNLIAGKKCCRCSTRYHYNIAEISFLAKKLGVDIISDPKVYANFYSKIDIRCKLHGLCKIHAGKILTKEILCPECWISGQKYVYLAIVYDNMIATAVKFGISNDPVARVKHQSRINKFKGELAYIFEFKNSEIAKEVEKKIKKRFKTGYLSKYDYRDGYSETVSIEFLDELKLFLNNIHRSYK